MEASPWRCRPPPDPVAAGSRGYHRDTGTAPRLLRDPVGSGEQNWHDRIAGTKLDVKA